MKVGNPSLLDILQLCAKAREDERRQYEALVGPWDAEEVAAWNFRRPGVKFALYTDDFTPVCAGGWDQIAPGVWQDWMVGTDDGWCQHWRTITRESRRVIEKLFEAGARRVQIHALASRSLACRWYEKGLGMRREGTLRGYGMNGEDVAMFARVKET